MIRLGLCCAFKEAPIKFFNTTATSVARLGRKQALEKLSELCLANVLALKTALNYCAENEIGCFRVNSQILPLKTHPKLGYSVDELPDGARIVAGFKDCGKLVREKRLRACFHPDQFVVLNSQRSEVIEASLREIEYQAEVAEWIEADVVNIHGGGAFGDKTKSLELFRRSADRLSRRARSRLTVENDDITYTPQDLLPLCRKAGIPLVYDAHHHRCNKDELSVQAATMEAASTWQREPMFHISSPVDGWDGPQPRRHHDFIDINDFPKEWLRLDLTVEVEAKSKESAVFKLQRELKRVGAGRRLQTTAS